MDAERIRQLEPRLAAYLERFGDCFARRDTKLHFPVYVRGQLSELPRKSVEPMALAANMPVRTLQEFLTFLKWDENRMRERVASIVAQEHADNKALARVLAKAVTVLCVRNTFLEDLHSGTSPSSKAGDFSDVKVVTPYGEIAWDKLSRISDEEMKRLMKEVVNNVYSFLCRQDDPAFIEAVADHHAIRVRFRGIVQGVAQRAHTTHVLDLAQRPRGDAADFRRSILERARQRIDRCGLLDLTEGPRRPGANTHFGIA